MTHSPPNVPVSTDEPRQKAVLFCQDCGHESPINGDWSIRTQGDHLLYMCPQCRHVLMDRPRRSGSSTQSPAPVAQLTGAFVRFWLTPTISWPAKDDPCSMDTDTRLECCA